MSKTTLPISKERITQFCQRWGITELALFGSVTRSDFKSARIALNHVSGLTWDNFCQDIRTQDAVIRRLEIIGETARRISKDT